MNKTEIVMRAVLKRRENQKERAKNLARFQEMQREKNFSYVKKEKR